MILHLFAGPGGFDVGCATAGHTHGVGIEWDGPACDTRRAVGHATIRADVAQYTPEPFRGRISGMTGGPPCPTFSAAGKGEGRKQIGQILDRVRRCRDGWMDAALDGPWTDPRTPLVLEPLRYAWTVRPEWITLEQVPAVLPVWNEVAEVLRGWGYSAQAAILNAADYGVPQTRKRAVLVAHRGRPARLPVPTHAKTPEPDFFGGAPLPWVTMAEALGWDGEVTTNDKTSATGRLYVRLTVDPSPTVRSRTDQWRLRGSTRANAALRSVDEPAPVLHFGGRLNDVSWVRGRPATSVCGDPRIGRPGSKDWRGGESAFDKGAVRITLAEAATLQSFPPNYPFQGNKSQSFQQVGNAVPPLLASHIIRALTE